MPHPNDQDHELTVHDLVDDAVVPDAEPVNGLCQSGEFPDVGIRPARIVSERRRLSQDRKRAGWGMVSSCLTALSRHRNAYFTRRLCRALPRRSRRRPRTCCKSARRDFSARSRSASRAKYRSMASSRALKSSNGDDGGHGLAVARDDGRRSVLGPRDDLGEVRAGIPHI